MKILFEKFLKNKNHIKFKNILEAAKFKKQPDK